MPLLYGKDTEIIPDNKKGKRLTPLKPYPTKACGLYAHYCNPAVTYSLAITLFLR